MVSLVCSSCGPLNPLAPIHKYWCMSLEKNREPKPKKYKGKHRR